MTGVTITSRLFENQHDFEQMQNLLMEARSLTSDWRYAHVGELAFNYFMVAIHLNPQEHIRLWHDHKKLVGYAILGEDRSIREAFRLETVLRPAPGR